MEGVPAHLLTELAVASATLGVSRTRVFEALAGPDLETLVKVVGDGLARLIQGENGGDGSLGMEVDPAVKARLDEVAGRLGLKMTSVGLAVLVAHEDRMGEVAGYRLMGGAA